MPHPLREQLAAPAKGNLAAPAVQAYVFSFSFFTRSTVLQPGGGRGRTVACAQTNAQLGGRCGVCGMQRPGCAGCTACGTPRMPQARVATAGISTDPPPGKMTLKPAVHSRPLSSPHVLLARLAEAPPRIVPNLHLLLHNLHGNRRRNVVNGLAPRRGATEHRTEAWAAANCARPKCQSCGEQAT